MGSENSGLRGVRAVHLPHPPFPHSQLLEGQGRGQGRRGNQGHRQQEPRPLKAAWSAPPPLAHRALCQEQGTNLGVSHRDEGCLFQPLAILAVTNSCNFTGRKPELKNELK